MKKYIILFSTLIIWGCGNKSDSMQDPGSQSKTVEFSEDHSLFANPERGWYTHRGWNHASDAPLTASSLVNIREKTGVSLVFTIYYLGDYLNGAIDNSMLELIRNNMIIIREAGMKCVLRFAYSQDMNDKAWDAPLSITLDHISQLAPILQENSDVIAVMEAGFIGVWGEWAYSTNYGYPVVDFAKRKVVIDALLKALPKNRMLNVRTPSFKTGLLGISFRDTLIQSEAYSGTDKSRLGHHNDCFLANANDMGTFTSTESRVYTEGDTKYVCMGGETCAPSSYSECTKSIESMQRYHWSYLNKDYHAKVISDWRLNGCFDEIQNRLGYRYVLQKAEYKSENNKLNLKISFTNSGFAPLYNPRETKILIRDKATKSILVKHNSTSNPRSWMAGKTISLNEQIDISSLAKGDYEVIIYLPDPNENLATRSEYAIRFANEKTWEKETGYNILFELKI